MARNRLIAGYRSTAWRSGMAVQGGVDGAAGLAMGQLMPGVSARTEPTRASPIGNTPAGMALIGNIARGAENCGLRWAYPLT